MTTLIGMKELATHLDISVKALRIRVSKGKIAQPVKREGDELFWDRKVLGVTPLVVDDCDAADDLNYALSAGGLRRDEAVVLSAASSKDKTVLPQSDVPEEHLHAIIYSTKHLIQDDSGERKQHTGYRRGVRNQRLTKKARG